MTGKKIKVGIIGTGFGAKVHAPIMNSHPGFEVTAISSVHRGNLDEIRKDTGVNSVYSDWKEMLEQEDLDLVSVASAPYLHHDMVLEVLKRKLHILCEKPMAFDASQSSTMLELQKGAGVHGFINFEFRFLPARQKVKEILASGKLGEIMHVQYSCNYNAYTSLTSNFRGWLGQKQYGGGMLGAIGSHMFDSLTWWINDEVSEIYGQLPTHVPSVTKDGITEDRTAEDTFQAIGMTKNGTTFTVDFMSTSRHSSHQWRLSVYGTEGTLVMTDDNSVKLAIGDEAFDEVELSSNIEEPASLSPRARSYYQAFFPMLDGVYESIVSEKLAEHVPTFESGHRVQLILDGIRKSALEGKKTNL